MIKPKVKIEEKTKGWKKFLAEMKRVDGAHVTLGVHEKAGAYPNGVSVAQVAMWHEFGTDNMPMRSFIRSALAENMGKLNTLRDTLLKNIASGKMDVNKALNSMGFIVKEWIVNKIQSNIPPPLTGATAARKAKQGKPVRTLIDTGLLLRSIAYKVRMR